MKSDIAFKLQSLGFTCYYYICMGLYKFTRDNDTVIINDDTNEIMQAFRGDGEFNEDIADEVLTEINQIK